MRALGKASKRAVALGCLALAGYAQTPAGSQPYTFQANTQVVLIDVTVTDAADHPVHGLPQSAFRVFDNNRLQAVASFEEHGGTPVPAAEPASSPGVYSNDYLRHLPPALNVMLIDIAILDIGSQMYLGDELTKLLNVQPPGQPVAIYLRSRGGCFLVQNFTSDRSLLLEGLHKAIPRFPPLTPEYLSDFNALRQIAVSLADLPGRKNVLWFSGGGTRFLDRNPVLLKDDDDWRGLYDDLNLERIAIYPIDARGLVTLLRPDEQLMAANQHLALKLTAQATGGEAFYNNNGLTEITRHVLDSDRSFYTLTYSPQELQLNNKWHRIRIAVAGGNYHLSYRTGYFADGSLQRKERAPEYRTILTASGPKLKDTEERTQPLIFKALVRPASDPSLFRMEKPTASLAALPRKKGSVPFAVRFTLPTDALRVVRAGGKQQITIGIADITLNRDGIPVQKYADEVTLAFRGHAAGSIMLDQRVNLTKEDRFLRLAVWDRTSGRFGTVQVPVDIRHKSGEAARVVLP